MELEKCGVIEYLIDFIEVVVVDLVIFVEVMVEIFEEDNEEEERYWKFYIRIEVVELFKCYMKYLKLLL